MTPGSNLAVRASRGAAASVALQGVGQIVAIAATTVVARILTPNDYGVLGLALLVSLPLVGVVDIGMTVALARAPRLTPRGLNSAFWLTLVGMLVGMGLAAPLGYLSAQHWGQGPHATAVAFGAVAGLLIVPAAAPRAVLARSLRFGPLALTDALGIALGAVVSIVLAVAGAGVWALIANVSVRALGSTVFSLAFARFRPKAEFSFPEVSPLLRFGSRSAASSTLSYAGRNADNLIVARYLGPHDLGVYQVAFGVAMLPASYIGITVSAIGVPVYGMLTETPERVRRAFLEGLCYLALASGTLAVALWWFAPLIVRVLYGTQWTAAVFILEILCIAALGYPLSALSSSILFACNKPTYDLALQAVRAVGVTVFSYVGYRVASLTGVAWGVAAYSCVNTVLYIILAGHVAEIRLRTVARVVLSGGWTPALVAIALAAARSTLHPGPWPTVAVALLAAAAIAGAVPFTQPALVERLRASLRGRGDEVEPAA